MATAVSSMHAIVPGSSCFLIDLTVTGR
jgi:hypothetical protein